MESYKFKLSFSLPAFVGDVTRLISEQEFEKSGIAVKVTDKQIICSCNRRGDNAFRTIRETATLIQDALPDASLRLVSPDLIPEKTACNLLKIGPAKFKALRASAHFSPRTITRSDKQHWHLKEILDWMRDHRGEAINPAIYATAEASYRINNTSHGVIEKPRNTSGFGLPEKYSARSFEPKTSFNPNIYR